MNYSWFPDYLRSILRRPRNVPGLRHLIFCVADHFEPFGWKQARDKNMARVDEWVAAYPKAFQSFRDADGCTPRHTLFCSQEDYAPDYIEKLKPLVTAGHGEIELHLHHRNDTPDGFRSKLVEFRDALHEQHGLLGKWRRGRFDANVQHRTSNTEHRRKRVETSTSMLDVECSMFDVQVSRGQDVSNGQAAYGFVHGNWALCNARPDGDWCGVNEELAILAETGCYADFTFPSAPDPTQPRIVNSIYRAVDNPNGRGQETGVPCHVSHSNTPTLQHSNSLPSLLLIQGPLALDCRRRKWGLVPRLENADISRARPPSPERADIWVRQHIHVRGRPDWVFVKVHTHGIVPYNTDAILGKPMQRTHEHLTTRYNDGRQWVLHYVTAREMYNIVRAAEDGMEGNPGEYRNYEIMPPPCTGGN